MESESAGAYALAGHSPSLPLAQKVSVGQGAQSVPLDALPSYPGRQLHCVTEMLPSGEMELAGHEAGTNTGGAELVKPSTVALAARMAA